MIKPLRYVLFLLPILAIASAQTTRVSAQQPSLFPTVAISEGPDIGPPPFMPPSPSALIEGFTQAESRFREELNRYSFRRDVVLQTIGPDGKVTGEYIRNSLFVFDDRGGRVEKVLYHPKSTIREMVITKEDIQDLAGAQLFGLDVSEVGSYRVACAGQDILDGRATYVLMVQPARAPDPHRMRERFFSGRVWVDAATLQVVKVRGKALPEGKQRFPVFETLREKMIGNYFFPTRTSADDVLHFRERAVHYRIQVRYYDFKRFSSRVRIVELDVNEKSGR